eukprot:CAMPEP_0115014174 /NCGR_PEP_ID=MMETSP0216-20121206/25897_1 /TAXON_ID=223996 /ORGANISM="Protocruzia adherens, Strain Boccale" /LENGTH=144 /DNA_ID=CAMNT_0002383815 /DNA_START=439 /DNA_END=869 /DNA_ORIENTATION=-
MAMGSLLVLPFTSVVGFDLFWPLTILSNFFCLLSSKGFLEAITGFFFLLAEVVKTPGVELAVAPAPTPSPVTPPLVVVAVATVGDTTVVEVVAAPDPTITFPLATAAASALGSLTLTPLTATSAAIPAIPANVFPAVVPEAMTA